MDSTKLFYNKKGTRIFLSQVKSELGEIVLQKELAKVFESFGTVEEVFVPTRSTKSYAFVRLATPEEAQRALEEIKTPHPLFKTIKPANEDAPRNKKFDRLKQEAKAELCEKETILSQSNVIFQTHRSHSERLESFFKESNTSLDFTVVALIPKTCSKTVSLILVNAENPLGFCDWVRGISYLQNIIHRVFLVQDPVIQGSIESESFKEVLKVRLSRLDKGVIRLQTFPPKLSTPILQVLESLWERLDNKDCIDISPTHSTHILGVVQIIEAVPDINDGLFCLGLWESTHVPMPTPSPSLNNQYDDDVCRAYWKIQEAFERYKFSLPNGLNIRVLDCGAAPGGWTQFAARNLNCCKIISIDPGALAPIVAQIPIVEHWAMTIQKALPKLQEEQVSIDVWISDMCVKDMEAQIDWVLQAREMNVVRKGTFFVLTLKCVTGHSSKTFDLLVEQQIKRLQPLAKDLQVLHLFSNRNSERTVIGYFV